MAAFDQLRTAKDGASLMMDRRRTIFCAAFAAALVFVAGMSLVRAQGVPRVYPSGATLPENVLRISIMFDSPQAGHVFDAMKLRYADGSAVGRPFLNQELWTPDGRTLTLLFDPGRVKTGTVAHETLGYALVPGRLVRLYIAGTPAKTWRVIAAQRGAPNPNRWRIVAPPAGTRQPVKLYFDRPLDHLSCDGIAPVTSANRRVSGVPSLARHELLWAFTPTEAWPAGRYRLVVDPRIEDPEGNAITGSFEEPASSASGRRTRPISLRFRVVGPGA